MLLQSLQSARRLYAWLMSGYFSGGGPSIAKVAYHACTCSRLACTRDTTRRARLWGDAFVTVICTASGERVPSSVVSIVSLTGSLCVLCALWMLSGVLSAIGCSYCGTYQLVRRRGVCRDRVRCPGGPVVHRSYSCTYTAIGVSVGPVL